MLYLLCIKFPVFSYLSSEHRLRYATSARNLCKNQKYGTIGWQKKNKIIKKKKKPNVDTTQKTISLEKVCYRNLHIPSCRAPRRPRQPCLYLCCFLGHRPIFYATLQPASTSQNGIQMAILRQSKIQEQWMTLNMECWKCCILIGAWRIVRHCTPSPPGQDT